MSLRAWKCGVLLACVGAAAAVAQKPAATMDALRAGFLNPPDAAKPMVRWWWFGPAVVKPEILKELEQMKGAGIGGAELAFVYPEVVDDPAKGLKNLAFLSPEMLDDVHYAQEQGRRLGLRIDVTLCSGWPYGGPSITLEEAVTSLRTAEVAVPAGATTAAMPKLAEGDNVLSAALVFGTPTPPRQRGVPAAAVAPPAPWAADAEHAKTFTPGAAFAAAERPRVALFFIQSHTRQQVKRAAVGAEGYVLDPFSHEAVAKHLQNVGEPLVKAFGNTPPYAIFSDSLEAYGADWTPKLPEEFRKRNGYDLLAHLPELVGGGSAAAEKVRHDYGKTLTELVNENYLVQITDWAKAHGTKFRSQTYGEPAVNFSSQSLVSLAEGEGPQWRAFSTLRWATSANHVFGNNVTSGETFTWLHSPVFRATPLDMKAEADIDFIMGENQLIFHGWPYSPPRMPDGQPEVPEPGWSLYAAASFNAHNPWFPVESAVNRYIARMSFLMRQGEPANQVAVLLPEDDAWASFSPGHTTMTGALAKLVTPELMSAILSAGYNVDFIDAQAIDKVGFGNHQIVVIPPTKVIPIETVMKLDAWVAKSGGKVVYVGQRPSPEVKQPAAGEKLPPQEIYDRLKAMQSIQKAPLVANVSGLGKALHDAAAPDFQLVDADDATSSSLGFVRRKLGDADIYFVVNTSNQTVHATAALASTHRFIDQADPDTGVIEGLQGSPVQLHLAPYESRVFLCVDGGIYKDKVPAANVHISDDLSENWNVTFSGIGRKEQQGKLTDWTANADTLHYSGEAVYSRDFKVSAKPNHPVYLQVDGGEALPGAPNAPPEHEVLAANGLPNPLITRPGPGMHAYFDPPIREAAMVFINGQEAGALWHPPYRLDVTKLLKPGTNHIEIHVYNTALNAWSAQPAHDYKPLIDKYGDRFQMQDMDKVKPVSSGILGTIKLVEMEPGK